VELKDPRPALLDNDEPEEKRWPHEYITSGFEYWLSAGERRYSRIAMSSSVGESHPHALPEPDVNLSTHPAPIDQPQ